MNKPNLLLKRDWLLLVLSDEHCGHVAGLTHPVFQGKFIHEDTARHNKFVKVEQETWNFFASEIKNLQRIQPIDILVNNGDFLDGTGHRSGGTELITSDRNKQIEICKQIVETVNAKHNLIIAGTAYHTGESEDWEETLSKEIKARFGSHDWLTINGKTFDFKHHIGSSSTPHTRYTPIAKDALWTKLWSEAELIPQKINYIIRSHVHYFSSIDDGKIVALTTPALQSFGSKYGARRCSGIPTIGFISFLIKANGSVIMQKHLANIPSQTAKAMIFQ